MSFTSFFTTGCLNEKINKTDYYLGEIFEGYHFLKNQNSYILTDVMNNQYIYYFDSVDYKNNYFSIFVEDEEIKYYYAKDLLKSDGCELEEEALEENGRCSEDISSYRRVIFSFETMNQTLRVTKKDLYIVESEVKNKVIHVEGN